MFKFKLQFKKRMVLTIFLSKDLNKTLQICKSSRENDTRECFKKWRCIVHTTKANSHLHAAYANWHIVRIVVPKFCEKVKCLKEVSSRWLSLCDIAGHTISPFFHFYHTMKDDDLGDGGSADDDDYADGEASDNDWRWKKDCLTLWCCCNRSEKSPSSQLELRCPGT